MLIERSKAGSSGYLSPAELRNVQNWWDRSEQIARKMPIVVEAERRGRAEMSQVIEALGADREIPPVTTVPSSEQNAPDIRNPIYLMLTDCLAPSTTG